MARKYIINGKIYEETGQRKVIVAGKILEETTAAAAGSVIPVFMRSYRNMRLM